MPAGGSVLRWLVELLRDWRTLPALVDALAEHCSGPEHAGMREGFAMVVEEAMLAADARLDAVRDVVQQVKHPRRGAHMTWQIAKEFEQARREGREEGLAQGVVQGETRGREQFAVRFAARKFGTETADELRRALASAGPRAAEQIADAIVDSDNGDELLARLMSGDAAN